jgi:hypothetical protein
MSICLRRLILVTVAATVLATRADAGICVDVNLDFDGVTPSHDMVATLAKEATAIWAPYGVDLHWQSPACDVQDASFNVLIERHLPHPSIDRQVLGQTQVLLSRVDRVPIVIDADATARTLGSLTIGELSTLVGCARVGAPEMGRAFGRIVAHEIGHVLLGLPNHQREGLMRPSFQAADMVRPQRWQYTLSPLEVARLRHRSSWMIVRRIRVTSPDFLEEQSPVTN